ncbi:VOC family protein [Paenisporosarcina sp. OV554]|uniref:VOC family protein n=1 Tax=Paenisporosarcina sp. OV554 TaxID=2135694 RepID=UPI000D3D48BB|nr:VOC family protein [Paenisporosarcina sp. OV554]PUB10446.1 putative 3-demethylubiquinone-9 3-methyltransferase (glyoxalase superfamily) [Paenisporosarcina sp. OV554]
MEQSKQKIHSFLMFEGNAEEAMAMYTSLFEESEIINIIRYGPNESGDEGSVLHATFSVKGQEFMASDSYVKHDFTFTPSISMFVTCDSEEEIDVAYAKLSQGGEILMPLADYSFSAKFGWVNDKFGVSWQLSLPLEF